MNTNLIILNAIRESTKLEKGGYIILDWNSKNTPHFRVGSPEVNDQDAFYTIHPGKNYYYVPYKSITDIGLTYNPMDSSKYVNSITFINFDLIDNLSMDYDFGNGCIYNFIDCKKITTYTPYIIYPQSNVRILCNNGAIINLYQEHSSYGQYTTDTCLEALNCDLSKTTNIYLCNTKYTDIYIGDCITTAKYISTDYTTSKTSIKYVHIDKYDKDNIKLNMDQWACKNIIIIDDSTLKKYKPIYNADKMQFAEIVNGTYSIPSLLKLTFTANADTTVKVYFTKESYDADTPDNTIYLYYANHEVVTSYARESIYKFKIEQPNVITSAKIGGALLNCELLLEGCSKLTTLDISKLDTSKVTDMSEMFCGCSNLTTLDISNLDVSNVTNMYGMFIGCSNLTTLEGLSKFNTSKVTNMNSMFYDCSKLSTIGPVDTASGWQHKPTDYASMFSNCPATPKPSWYKS